MTVQNLLQWSDEPKSISNENNETTIRMDQRTARQGFVDGKILIMGDSNNKAINWEQLDAH